MLDIRRIRDERDGVVAALDRRGGPFGPVVDRVLELDPINPQVAARILAPLSRWKRYRQRQQKLMVDQLERIRRYASLSNDVSEIVEKSLLN